MFTINIVFKCCRWPHNTTWRAAVWNPGSDPFASNIFQLFVLRSLVVCVGGFFYDHYFLCSVIYLSCTIDSNNDHDEGGGHGDDDDGDNEMGIEVILCKDFNDSIWSRRYELKTRLEACLRGIRDSF
jgi:hypothetical protein